MKNRRHISQREYGSGWGALLALPKDQDDDACAQRDGEGGAEVHIPHRLSSFQGWLQHQDDAIGPRPFDVRGEREHVGLELVGIVGSDNDIERGALDRPCAGVDDQLGAVVDALGVAVPVERISITCHIENLLGIDPAEIDNFSISDNGNVCCHRFPFGLIGDRYEQLLCLGRMTIIPLVRCFTISRMSRIQRARCR